MAFDKTGTLTEGRPKVTDVVVLASGTADRALLRMAAAVEEGSSRPLERAILERAAPLGIDVPTASDAHAVPGRAVQATLGGHVVAVGSPRHAEESGSGIGMKAESLETEDKTVVTVLADDRTLGLIALRDEPRAEAMEGIAALKRLGLVAVMLTGDNERTARAIAGTLGLDVRAGLLPEDKLRQIARLREAAPW